MNVRFNKIKLDKSIQRFLKIKKQLINKSINIIKKIN